MFGRIRIKKAFCLRIIIALLAALFVGSVYLFFSDSLKTPFSDSQANQLLPHSTALTGSKPEFEYSTKSTDLVINDRALPSVVRGDQSDSINDNESISTLLSQLLQDYHSSALDPDQKLSIRKILPEISQSAEGREFLAKFFFHSDPEMAASMYDMILDARLKDANFIAELIERDEIENRPDYKLRLIDLIADHNTVEQVHQQRIEDFLADMALHADEQVKLAAVSQWAWYVNKHKGILPVLDAYLLNPSYKVRKEVYEMLDLNAITDENQKREVLLALETLQYAEYLGLSEEEKIKINKLKTSLRP